MIFTASDVSFLSAALSRWELAEYISCGLVAIGCAGEYLAEFTNLLTDGTEESKGRLAKRSTLLLIFALSLELICLVRTNMLSATLTGSLANEAGEADSKAKTALTNSGAALIRSGEAEGSSKQALDESNKATTSASNALGLARGARREADSFEKDIVSAKTQATEAESHLAEALARAKEATVELNRLKSPRSLLPTPELIATLQVFKGTEYTFSSVYPDEESIKLLVIIDGVLQNAGWKRTKPPTRSLAQAIAVYPGFPVLVGVNTGIQISVDSSESLTTLQSLPLDKLPQPVRAAITLNIALSSNISPPQGNAAPVQTEPGTSGIIRIAVGKKP
ncbi:MAG: hypothetical protein ACYDDI_02965 [Candidatus Acidiferrales bacterium]